MEGSHLSTHYDFESSPHTNFESELLSRRTKHNKFNVAIRSRLLVVVSVGVSCLVLFARRRAIISISYVCQVATSVVAMVATSVVAMALHTQGGDDDDEVVHC